MIGGKLLFLKEFLIFWILVKFKISFCMPSEEWHLLAQEQCLLRYSNFFSFPNLFSISLNHDLNLTC